MKSVSFKTVALAIMTLSLSALAVADPGDRPGHGRPEQPRPRPVVHELQCVETHSMDHGRPIMVLISHSHRGYQASISQGRHVVGFFDRLTKVERIGGTQYQGRDFNLNVAMGRRARMIGSLDAMGNRFNRIIAHRMSCNFVR